MTNPSDPWAQRPASPDAPTEQVGTSGRPEERQLHTTEYSEAYGYGVAATEPYQYFGQPPGPNATRELPAYDTQWGAYESGYGAPGTYEQQWNSPGAPPPGGIHPPTGVPPRPPRRNRTGLWIALTLAILVLVVLGGVAVGMLLAGGGDSTSSSAAGTTTTRSAPSTRIPLNPPPRTPGTPPSVPPLPGLGDIDNLGATMGTIAANDGVTLTIDSLLGEQVTVRTDAKTQVVSSGSGRVADLHPGDMVVVQGDKTPDGSILAKIIISTALSGPR
ncbi:DUF5666 domain-containing protein [Nocardia sp. CDC159]|uniref:DUF5666 domain-containing protein n=1 Tax=Nocardia pulmonis TaxID=2951408 RepID=A0A9X2IYQ7_9NOCA|nr:MULTISPECIES: DUF5666 domain-containing protein [Nocardia]MCM6777307.1 DUF5666 domain-containing protein [Nocardia pulmonis]MCM6790192.1 DUF5666 domain-containing protein [Nocardia sp. CDC159]